MMRYVVTFVALFVLVGVLGGLKAAQIGKLIGAGKQAEAEGPPPEVVASAVAKDEAWEGAITDVGSVASSKGVTLSNEVPGIVTRIAFDSGQKVKKGDVLVELDAKVEHGQLASAAAKKNLAATTSKRTEALVNTGALAQAQSDNDRTQLESANKDVETLSAQISKKVIRAPFDGELGIRAVNVGQYLNPGTKIAVIETDEALYVDFNVPQERISELAIGQKVRLESQVNDKGSDAGASNSAPREGAIEAIEPSVDPATRMVKVRASVPSDDGQIRPGMFVRATVVLPSKEKVVTIPTTALQHASYGDSVFLVEPKPAEAPGMRKTKEGAEVKVVRQQFVRTGQARGDFVSILDGLEPGKEVVTAGAFKLKNESPVVVNNERAPKPELSPHPANR